MSTLHAAQRNAIPSQEFGLPERRKFPMPDMSHVENAEARATQGVNNHTLSPHDKARVMAKAHSRAQALRGGGAVGGAAVGA